MLTRVRPGGRWVHPRLLGSLRFAIGVVGFVGFVRVRHGGRLVRSGVRWVHSRSLGLLRFTLGVIWFIGGRWVHSGSPRGPLGSSGIVGFRRFRPMDRWLHPVSLG